MLGKTGVPIKKTHRITLFKDWPADKNDVLIVILRDYKECIIRHLCTDEIVSAEMVIRLFGSEYGYRDRASQYLENLVLFDVYPYRKHLVYYEDLITIGMEYFMNTCMFFDRVPYFNWNKEFKESLNNYNGKKLSGGKINFHKFKLDDPVLMDNIMREYNPVIFNKYLKRYETNV